MSLGEAVALLIERAKLVEPGAERRFVKVHLDPKAEVPAMGFPKKGGKE
jgi:hypothetical protein